TATAVARPATRRAMAPGTPRAMARVTVAATAGATSVATARGPPGATTPGADLPADLVPADLASRSDASRKAPSAPTTLPRARPALGPASQAGAPMAKRAEPAGVPDATPW